MNGDSEALLRFADRGTLYKAQKGQLASVIKFSEQEKATFMSLNQTQDIKVKTTVKIER